MCSVMTTEHAAAATRGANRPARNHLIDVARVGSMLTVVLFHTSLYRFDLQDGQPVLILWEPEGAWRPLIWVLMFLPVFFVASGFANATTLDRMRDRGTSLGAYLTSRGRIAGPLTFFITCLAGLATIAASIESLPAAIPPSYPNASNLGSVDLAALLSSDFCALLWFVTVYLGLVLAAPLMVRLHDRWGRAGVIALAAAAAGVDWLSINVDNTFRTINMALVWALCHQLGIAYQRGWFRRGPVWIPVTTLGVGALAVPALILFAGYPPAAVSVWHPELANSEPPTLAMACLALAQISGIALLERVGVLRVAPPTWERRVGYLNAVLVTIYLWHTTCILLAFFTLTAVSSIAPPLTPYAFSEPAMIVTTAALLFVLIPRIARLEYRLVPHLGESQSAGLAVGAFVLLILGTTLVRIDGTVLHPAHPLSTAGVCSIWLGSWLMAKAADWAPRGSRKEEGRGKDVGP